MKKFLYSTLVFTAVSVVVQYLLDVFYPLGGGKAPEISLSSLGNLDALLADPVALNALQQQLSVTGGASFSRLIAVTIITLCLLLIWPTVRQALQAFLLRRRGLHWERNARFLSIVHTADALEPGDNPLLVKERDHVVKNFVWRGTNVSDAPMTGLGGFIRSAKTKQTLPLLLDGQPLTDQSRIAPDSAFVLMAPLRLDGSLLTPKHFLKRFGEFDFVFEYNGYRYKRRFTLEKVVLALRKHRGK